MASKRAGRTVKLSVSLGIDDLALLKRQAKRNHGGNLSAAIAEAARLLKKQEAGYRLIEALGGATLTPQAGGEIDAEQAGGARYEPKKTKRTKAA